MYTLYFVAEDALLNMEETAPKGGRTTLASEELKEQGTHQTARAAMSAAVLV